MTPIRYQAVYAQADSDAARRYRTQRRDWFALHEQRMNDIEFSANISDEHRKEFLNGKALTEARQVLHA
ncbi:MAG TPA: hypothetical protein VHL14_03025 [Steroidobacteraceae bacterium]|jgi:hypothetical protein|nr:hypothetical protein [Steroidobacteraceae bacterium]